MRPIDASSFTRPPTLDAGPAPVLQWIEVAKLRVDETYQRPIRKAGAKNIAAIVAKFDWAKFSPVIVAPLADGLFAIIDGQHRATAAAACGFASVPCEIVIADPAEQASAFAAINGVVTKMSPMQIHHAEVAAGEPDAVLLDQCCREAKVTILRYPLAANLQEPGQTMAASRLRGLLRKYGAPILVDALKCLSETANRETPGLIRAPMVEGLCEALQREPSWRGETLLDAMDDCDLAQLWDRHCRNGRIAAAITAEVVTYLHQAKAAA